MASKFQYIDQYAKTPEELEFEKRLAPAIDPVMSVQPETIISADPNVDGFTVPDAHGYKGLNYTNPAAQSALQNSREGIIGGIKRLQAVKPVRQAEKQKYDEDQGAYNKQIGILTEAPRKYQPSMDYDAESRNLKSQYDQIQDPEQSEYQKIFEAVLPLAFATMGGEAGALSAPKSLEQTQKYKMAMDKISSDKNIKLRDNISKRIEALSKAKEQDLKQFSDQEKMIIDKAVAGSNAIKAGMAESGNQYRKGLDLDQKTIDQVNKLYEQGSFEPAKLQQSVEEKEKDRSLSRENNIRTANAMSERSALARESKQADKARLSDKQIEAFTDLDRAESDLNNIISSMRKDDVGPISGRIPDLLSPDRKVAFRSAIGKYKDAYRQAITGAGASTFEIEQLAKRLPGDTDTPANFLAKAKEAKKELVRRRETLAQNLAKGGKDVSNFEQQSAPERTVLKTQVNKKTGQTRIIYSDGSIEIK